MNSNREIQGLMLTCSSCKCSSVYSGSRTTGSRLGTERDSGRERAGSSGLSGGSTGALMGRESQIGRLKKFWRCCPTG